MRISALFVALLLQRGAVSKVSGNERHGAQIGHQWPSNHFPQEGDDVQKKTFALAGLAVAAAGGVLLTGSPANAALVQGHRHHHYSSHRNYNRNANWNRNRNGVVVRVNVRNRNNNVAFAGRERERDDDFGLFRNRGGGCGFGCGGRRFGRFDRFDDDDFGRDRDDDDRGDNIIVGNDIRTAGDRG
jgi:hypothetical protein